MNMMVKAEMIRSVMTDRGYSPKDVALHGGVSLRTAYRILAEPGALVTAATAQRLAAALGVPVNLITVPRMPTPRNGNQADR